MFDNCGNLKSGDSDLALMSLVNFFAHVFSLCYSNSLSYVHGSDNQHCKYMESLPDNQIFLDTLAFLNSVSAGKR